MSSAELPEAELEVSLEEGHGEGLEVLYQEEACSEVACREEAGLEEDQEEAFQGEGLEEACLEEGLEEACPEEGQGEVWPEVVEEEGVEERSEEAGVSTTWSPWPLARNLALTKMKRLVVNKLGLKKKSCLVMLACPTLYFGADSSGL